MLPTITRATPDPESRVLVLNGHGVSAKVTEGSLRLEDGMHRSDRRVITLDRATTNLDRLVILMRDGWLSFDALAWCHALGIQVVLIDRDGNASPLNSVSRLHDARLRRAQALAPGSEQGLAVARYLLTAKCQGQQANLLQLGYDTLEIQRETSRVETATKLQQCHLGESRLAGIYWDCWNVVPLRWQERKNGRKSHVPEHWRTVGLRISPRTGKPRGAVTPAHAILNYLYSLAEVETTIALHAVGLDPALGIVHTDAPNRDSMSLDVLEAIRPTVDAYLLDFLDVHTFSFSDVAELPSGEIRLSTALRQELTTTLPLWRAAVAPVAEHVANLLRPETRTGRKVVRTPLTNANIRASQVEMKQQRVRAVAANGEVHPDPLMSVEAALQSIPASWEEIYPLVQETPTELLAQVTGLKSRYVRRIKRGGRVPHPQRWLLFYRASRGDVARGKVPTSEPERMPTTWAEILPLVQRTPTVRLVKATGLSDEYVRKIKREVHTPHARRWKALYEAGHEYARQDEAGDHG